MGWMHDTLAYSGPDPVHRAITRRAHVQPPVRLHGELRAAALARRGCARQGLADPEDARRPLAEVREPARALRLHVGAPGQEAALHGRRARAGREWNHDTSLDWHLRDVPEHGGVQALVRDLNHAYRAEPALWELDFDPAASSGSTPTTPTRTWSPSSGSPVPASVSSSARATSHRYRARATGWVCRVRASGASS